MRKTLAMALMVAMVAAFSLFAAAAFAEPSDTCGSSDPAAVVQTANGAVICINGTGVADGSISLTAVPNEADPTTSTGYLVVDGDSTNAEPLDGYIGVEGNNAADGGGVNVVGCANGDYAPAGENNVILHLGPDTQPPNPTIPPEPDPCDPQPPA